MRNGERCLSHKHILYKLGANYRFFFTNPAGMKLL